jgi:hypothetical protein
MKSAGFSSGDPTGEPLLRRLPVDTHLALKREERR